jgi:hypothetical protein
MSTRQASATSRRILKIKRGKPAIANFVPGLPKALPCENVSLGNVQASAAISFWRHDQTLSHMGQKVVAKASP